MGSAWGLLFNKSFHLNNPESITIKYITFLSSLLPGIYLFCFVLARLNPHILFVQAIHQICQAGNSWGFLSLAEKRNFSLSYHMHSYFYLTLSWNTPAAEHIEYFIDHKMSAAIRGFFVLFCFFPEHFAFLEAFGGSFLFISFSKMFAI